MFFSEWLNYEMFLNNKTTNSATNRIYIGKEGIITGVMVDGRALKKN